MHVHRFITACGSLLFAALLASGCKVTEQCNDCGDCGLMGGPNQADAILVLGEGVTTDGTPAVELALSKKGECGSDAAFLLRWEARAATLQAEDKYTGFDGSAVEGPNGVFTFAWQDRDLQLRYEEMGAEATFTFTEAGSSWTTKCAVVGSTIACAPQ